MITFGTHHQALKSEHCCRWTQRQVAALVGFIEFAVFVIAIIGVASAKTSITPTGTYALCATGAFLLVCDALFAYFYRAKAPTLSNPPASPKSDLRIPQQQRVPIVTSPATPMTASAATSTPAATTPFTLPYVATCVRNGDGTIRVCFPHERNHPKSAHLYSYDEAVSQSSNLKDGEFIFYENADADIAVMYMQGTSWGSLEDWKTDQTFLEDVKSGTYRLAQPKRS